MASFLFAQLVSSKRITKIILAIIMAGVFLLTRKLAEKFFHPYLYTDFLLASVVFYLAKDLPKRIRLSIVLSTSFFLILAQMFWMGFKSPISFFDIYAIKEVYAYSLPIFLGLIAIAMFVIGTALITLWKVGRRPHLWVAIALLYASTYFLPPPNNWSPYVTYMKRGMAVSLFGELFEQVHAGIVSKDQRHLYYLAAPDLVITKKKNINILILESLVIPPLLTDEMKNLNVKMELPWQKMISPTFGGQSARSEFEILCGVPSYKKPFVEFNAIRRKLNCLPNFLKKFGYHTVVSNAASPQTFNARRAYSFLGFDEQIWFFNYKHLDRMERLEGGIIYEGSLLEENLEILKGLKAPYLNYIIGTYGHMPFYDDPVKRPRIFKSQNKQLEDVINIQIYREKEVIKWLGKLNAIDKDAINLVCGDHLPYIKDVNFGDMNFTNFCFSNIKLPETNFYKVTVELLKELGCEKCSVPEDMQQQYTYLLF